MDMYEKLKILADSAKYDVSCSTSGSARRGSGTIGSTSAAGICHTWSADGRCVSLLKVLYSNACAYDCEYCVNRRSADVPRATFEPRELAELTIEFYRRNYIEGLFISSAVLSSPDTTAERMLSAMRILRDEMGFAGYIHAKLIPGTSQELVHMTGLYADRVSVNIELPSSESLALLTPQKQPEQIFAPMRQVTNTLIERNCLKGPGTMFRGIDVNSPDNYLSGSGWLDREKLPEGSGSIARRSKRKESFAPAGQTTQMIVGASGESDSQILTLSENLYHTFKMKRVYFSAYVPVISSPVLPDSKPPLRREHRLYQADWLLRFYGFSAGELFTDREQNLDLELDPKISWALRHIELFPVEINRASYRELLRIPGIGTTSAQRIVRHRKLAHISYDELRKIGVVMKRAKYFITVDGRFFGDRTMDPERIKYRLTDREEGVQLSLFGEGLSLPGEEKKIGLLV